MPRPQILILSVITLLSCNPLMLIRFDGDIRRDPNNPVLYLNRAMGRFCECDHRRKLTYDREENLELAKGHCDGSLADMNRGLELAKNDKQTAQLLYFMRAMYYHKFPEWAGKETAAMKALADMEKVAQNPPPWSPLNYETFLDGGTELNAPKDRDYNDQRRIYYYRDLITVYETLAKDAAVKNKKPTRDYEKLIAQAKEGQRRLDLIIAEVDERVKRNWEKAEEETNTRQPEYKKRAHKMVQCHYCKGSGKSTSYSAGSGNYSSSASIEKGKMTWTEKKGKDSSWSSGSCPVCYGSGQTLANPDLHEKYHKMYNDPD